MTVLPLSAPYDVQGNLVRRVSSDVSTMWRPNEPFRMRLELVGQKHGMSSVYVEWKDSRQRTYPMFASSLVSLLQGGLVNRGISIGWWIVVKNGGYFGISQWDSNGENADD